MKIKKDLKSKNNLTSKDNFLMVGIGASAGGLEAFKEFFAKISENSGMAFILVQHLDPNHKSMLTEIIGRHTKMSVLEVEDGIVVKPNNVYIIPPNKYLSILDGALHLIDPKDLRMNRRPIDFFFKSLAKDKKEKAVGIVFSGTGTEGTLGLNMIKGEGGLTIVQDPDTAKFDGMPRNAIMASTPDFVLPISKIPEKLCLYKQNHLIKPLDEKLSVIPSVNVLEEIIILLNNATNCNFNEYKRSTVVRRIEKRMIITQNRKVENYLKFLQKNPEEVINLFQDLLIGVTNFFRDKDVFEQLQKRGVQQIVKLKKSGETIRVWIPACSTGEEVYSIAILFNEGIKKQKKNLQLQVFASDIDERAINFARLGIYAEANTADISTQLLKKYFQRETHSYRINNEIREQVVFAKHDVLNDPPFSNVDLISCRNFLIYLNPKAQQKILSLFHFALKPNGIMFLGNSESLGASSNLFQIIHQKSKIFQKRHKPIENKKELATMTEYFSNKIDESVPNYKNKNNRISLKEITEKFLLDNYAPACAVINLKGDALYFSGDTGRYLKPAVGEARLNIVDMAREGLKKDLRRAINKAITGKTSEIRYGVKIKFDDKIQNVDLRVIPISEYTTDESCLMITFDVQQVNEEVAIIKTQSFEKNESFEISELEEELASVKESLKITIEDLEMSNEEMKATNEELQSTNEELQSTNEELETSKEEMQSINEEIITVNGELRVKIDELDNAYNDINNFLASSHISTIFLDNDLIIKRFTTASSSVINLIETDIGRSITHLSFSLDYDNIIKDIREVQENLEPKRCICKNENDSWFQIQIVPYRTVENMIEGIVLTFVDITEEKKIQLEIVKRKKLYEELLMHTKTVIYKQDLQLQYIDVINSQTPFLNKEIIGKTDSELYQIKEEFEYLIKLKKRVIKTGVPIRDEVSITMNKKVSIYDLMIRPLKNDNNKTIGVICTLTDITELKK